MKKVIVIICIFLFASACSKDNREELKKTLSDYAEEFYKENLKGQVDHLEKVTISLEVLENNGKDISMFKNYKTKKDCDKENTQAIVWQQFDETEYPDKEYIIEADLVCDYE